MKNIGACVMMALLAGLGVPVSAMAGEIGVEILGPGNAFVRVTDPAERYLMIPVEDNAEESTLNLLVDGKKEGSVVVRLARTHVDYMVPFDLKTLPEGNLILDVVTPRRGDHASALAGDVCWKEFKLSDTFDTTNREKYRPLYHHTPEWGWMNDPNGMFYKDGEWHLYYQWNPYGSKWQNMTWGHSSSKDLVNWEHQPTAITPDGLGAIFSGSSAIDRTNSTGNGEDAVVALYTSAGTSQMQSLAVSKDNGRTFDKYPLNPVLTLPTEARDPNMFWNEKTGKWNIVLAHALDHEMLIFSSPDLKEWTLESSFGKGLGSQNGVWECPDLMELPVRGTDKKKWVLICNINPGGPFGGSATQYFVGDFDGKKFTVDTLEDGTVPTKWMDYGKDHYATVSWSDAPDNRRVVVGWMSNWEYANDVPTMQYRSANTLARDLELFEGNDGELYLASIPSPEIDAFRSKATVSVAGKKFSRKPLSFRLPEANDGVCEIDLKASAPKGGTFTITLSNAKGEKVEMTYDPKKGTLDFDRRQSGLTDFNPNFAAVTEAPVFRSSDRLGVRLFIDRSSIEVFDSEGNFAMTNLVFPTEPYTTLTLSAEGGSGKVESLKVYPIAVK